MEHDRPVNHDRQLAQAVMGDVRMPGQLWAGDGRPGGGDVSDHNLGGAAPVRSI
jgi:hypothetical protein